MLRGNRADVVRRLMLLAWIELFADVAMSVRVELVSQCDSSPEGGEECPANDKCPHIAPATLNCAAPDTGNIELLADFGSPAQRKRWLRPYWTARSGQRSR
jgi:hypothetical protein